MPPGADAADGGAPRSAAAAAASVPQLQAQLQARPR
jgi:hypothetical protein